MNTNESEGITPEFKQECENHYNQMNDNTEVDDENKKLKFVRMSMPAEHMDFIMNYYKLPNMVEVNRVSIYILKTLAHMEQDGYKFAVFKTEKNAEGKDVITSEGSIGLSITDMVNTLMKHMNDGLPPKK